MGNLLQISLTSSRIEDGYIAIPREYAQLLPFEKGSVNVILDGVKTQKPFSPMGSTTKEARIYDLRDWFVSHGLRAKDHVQLEAEAEEQFTFRLVVGNVNDSTEWRLHVCAGDPREHLPELSKPEETRSIDVKWWNVNATAREGHGFVLYMLQPVSAFVASGIIGRPVRPGEVDASSPFYGANCFWVKYLRLFERYVDLDEAKAALPDWKYLNRPGPTTLPNRTTPSSIVDRFLDLLGIEQSTMIQGSPPALDLEPPLLERVKTTTYRILRDTDLSRRVKLMHRHECQMCGHTIMLLDGSRYAEVHHIQPLGRPHDGPDVLGNVLCLRPNHHAELDYCVSPIDLNRLRRVNGHAVDPSFVEYHNRRVRAAGGDVSSNGPADTEEQ